MTMRCDRTGGSSRNNTGDKNGNYRLEIVLLRRDERARLRITGGLVRRRVGESHPDARQEASG